jgi:hypothetical protein
LLGSNFIVPVPVGEDVSSSVTSRA